MKESGIEYKKVAYCKEICYLYFHDRKNLSWQIKNEKNKYYCNETHRFCINVIESRIDGM